MLPLPPPVCGDYSDSGEMSIIVSMCGECDEIGKIRLFVLLRSVNGCLYG